MNIYPQSLEDLIEEFRKLPGVGRKSAQRLALSLVEKNKEEIDDAISVLAAVRDKIKKCPICNNLTDEEFCTICQDEKRDKDTICIVEDVTNLLAIEKSGFFKGRYFVLNGLISPAKGVGPEDVGIDKLIKMVDDDLKELILAISPTVEGETTMLFIGEIFKDRNIKVTRIASGIPVGGNLEYFDDVTLAKALEDRRDMKE